MRYAYFSRPLEWRWKTLVRLQQTPHPQFWLRINFNNFGQFWG